MKKFFIVCILCSLVANFSYVSAHESSTPTTFVSYDDEEDNFLDDIASQVGDIQVKIAKPTYLDYIKTGLRACYYMGIKKYLDKIKNFMTYLRLKVTQRKKQSYVQQSSI